MNEKSCKDYFHDQFSDPTEKVVNSTVEQLSFLTMIFFEYSTRSFFDRFYSEL